jgi:hypothetical protein
MMTEEPCRLLESATEDKVTRKQSALSAQIHTGEKSCYQHGFLFLIQDRTRNFVRITTYACDSAHSEVERFKLEASVLTI